MWFVLVCVANSTNWYYGSDVALATQWTKISVFFFPGITLIWIRPVVTLLVEFLAFKSFPLFHAPFNYSSLTLFSFSLCSLLFISFFVFFSPCRTLLIFPLLLAQGLLSLLSTCLLHFQKACSWFLCAWKSMLPVLELLLRECDCNVTWVWMWIWIPKKYSHFIMNDEIKEVNYVK